MKFKKYLFPSLVLILLIFCSYLRLNQITKNPPSLFSDEVDAAYQAFLFNQKNIDFFGNINPWHFHSFSDWRTPLFIRSISFSQKIFGYTDFATRFPSAFFGIALCLLLYFVVQEIFENRTTSILTLFLTTINPWAIHYSRVAFEVSSMLFFILLGFFFWLKFLKKQKLYFLYSSIISFVISVYFYSTAKLYIIFILISLFLVWHQKIFKLKKNIIFTSLIIGTLFLLPLLIDSINGKAGYRFSYINIFSDPTVSKTTDYLRFQDAVIDNGQKIGLQTSLKSSIFHNKIVLWKEKFLNNYISSFSTDYLFLKSDGNLRHGFSQHGYFYVLDALFILIGISLVISNSILFSKGFSAIQTSSLNFITLLLFFSPIPFALTRDSQFPHGTRLIIMLPCLIILSSLGITKFLELVKNKSRYFYFSFLLLIPFAYLFLFSFFNHFYYYHYPQLSARDWHLGIKDAIVESTNESSQKIYYSNAYESFIPFFLYYQKYLPNQSPVTNLVWDNTNYFTGMSLDKKFYFGHLEWPQLLESSSDIASTIFVIPQSEKQRVVDSINSYNNSSKSTTYNFNIIKTIDNNYLNQEKFLLLKLQ